MEESTFAPPENQSFDEVLTALLDEEQVLDPQFLYMLSDISPENLGILKKVWGEIHLERRRALIDDLEQLTDTNALLSFEPVFRLALKDEDVQVRFFGTRAIEIQQRRVRRSQIDRQSFASGAYLRMRLVHRRKRAPHSMA